MVSMIATSSKWEGKDLEKTLLKLVGSVSDDEDEFDGTDETDETDRHLLHNWYVESESISDTSKTSATDSPTGRRPSVFQGTFGFLI